MMEKLKEKYKYIILAVVLLIPFMYSFFYLKSYWNPYGNLNDLGVAIVNNDKTESISLSEQFISGLQDSDTCNFEVVSSKKANDGLTNGDYYAIITIPENFTDNMNNIGERNRQVTTITYSPNQKSNYLASQIISRIILEAEEKLEGNIASAVVGELVYNLNEVPESLDKIITATDEIKNGASTLSNGLYEINNGTNTLSNKYIELDNGINTVKNGVNELYNGSNSLVNGAQSINAGINSYTSSSLSLAKIAAGYCRVDPTNYSAYLSSVSGGTIDCSTIGYAVQNLSNGANQLKNGSSSLVSGAQSMKNGIANLQSGMNSLSSGSNSIKDGLNTLAIGTKKAYNGSLELNNGLVEFRNEIAKSKDETQEKLAKLDGLDDFMKDTVEIKEEPKGKVNEYGVSFTPLFLSIGLWVGALMCYVVIYYDQDHRFKLLDKKNRGIKQNFAYIGLSAIFGLVTAFLIKLLLGFNAVSNLSYYLSSMLIAITFMSIIQLLIRVFSEVGKFLALIILVLQLAASGGTFPVETISKGFRLLTNLLPMTYSIRLVKETIISKDPGFIFNNSSVLLGFTIVSILITTIYDIIKSKKVQK